jgi:putative ABC transport system permease protein
MVLWKFTVREIKNRPGRAALTLASIVIGVAAVVAVFLGIKTTRQAYKEMYESLSGRAAWEVVAEGGGFYEEAQVPSFDDIPGVKAAVPLFQYGAKLYHDRGRPSMVVMGIDPTKDEAVRDYELQEGTFFDEEGGVLMESGFAASLGLHVGDEIKLFTGKVNLLKILGLLNPKGAAGFNQGGVVVMPLTMAQQLYRRPGQINSTSIVLGDDVDPDHMRDVIASRLPTGLVLRKPAARAQLGEDNLQRAEQGLNFSAVLMEALAAIMVLNTFLMNVGERRRQISILRAVGTTRGQIVRMLLLEGLLMGATGTLIGSILGLGGAYLLAGAMASANTGTAMALCVSVGPFLLASILGPLLSVVAMSVPAWIASRVSPLEGMRPAVAESMTKVPWSFTLAGIATFLITLGILLGCIWEYLPISLITYAGVVFTVAFVLLIPAVLGPLTRAVAAVMRPFLGVEGQVAARQVIRRRARATLTIGVLYVAVSSGIALGTMILNSVEDVRTWQKKTMVGDFFVRALENDPATSLGVPIPEATGTEIRSIPGVAMVEAFSAANIQVENQPVLLIVREFRDMSNIPLYLLKGRPDEVRRDLFSGEVVVASVLAQRLGKDVGDTITLETREGKKPFRIAAKSTEYLAGGMVINIERQTAKRLLGVEGVNVFMVTATPGAQADAQAKLKSLCDEQGILLHSFADLRRRLDNLLRGVIACLWGLLSLGLVVSAFSIANTLTINVLEQTRELALLRVVAMTSRQVRRTIVAQAVILGMIGLTTGVIGGSVGAYTTNLCSTAISGQTIEFTLQPALLVGSFAVAFLIVLAAAWMPAARAAKLNLLIALQYE